MGMALPRTRQVARVQTVAARNNRRTGVRIRSQLSSTWNHELAFRRPPLDRGTVHAVGAVG